MTGVLGLLLRLLLRAFGVIAHESERPVGPPAAQTHWARQVEKLSELLVR